MITVKSVLTAICVSPLLLTTLATAYHWPSPQYDTLERFLFEGLDHFGLPIGADTKNCRTRDPAVKSTVAAEWTRLAYHDMATHNVDDGTGGLDASIFFELDRPENIGAGNFVSVNTDFAFSSSKYLSRADMIAMGVVMSVASCSGPIIPFKGGRIDALSAGRFGVPEPQQDLASHVESFRQQGFTPAEMIKLVACGHTLGGVRNADFPNLVPTTGEVENFDTTVAFDHSVVSEFLDGTTTNPLVVAGNATLRSDQRIFNSDGNAVMTSMNNAAAFSTTCATVFEKMINTVPRGVVLSETISLLPVKVSFAEITQWGSQLTLDVLLRLSEPPNVPVPPNRSVKMFWCDRRGTFSNCLFQTNVASNPVFSQGAVSGVTEAMGNTLSLYQFSAPITAEASVSKFWFQVDEGDGTPVKTYNNGGQGYAIDQDEIIHIPVLGSLAFDPSNGAMNYNVVVGVRSESNPTSIKLHGFDKAGVGSGPSADFTQDLTPATITGPPTIATGYKAYSAVMARPTISTSLTVDFEAVINGVTYTIDIRQTLHVADNPALARTLSTVATVPS